jgi:hypothetical protein
MGVEQATSELARTTGTGPVTVQELRREPRDILRFLKVSYPIYRNDPFWVAPLLIDLKQVFTDRNPLFEHAEMRLWVARQGDRDVGRIAGVIDRAHLEAHHDDTAFFGFFEAMPDPGITEALLKAVSDWALSRGLRRLVGPMNPTSNDECGLLVEGFDSLPRFMMPYNPRYYRELLEGQGFRKTKDLLAYQIDLSRCPMDRLGRIAGKVRRRNPDLTFRPVRRSQMLQDLGKIKEVYNAAWEDNWGFVPMTDAEVDFLAQRLKPLFMEGLVWVAETPAEPVGFLLALPDYNLPLQPLRGRLLTPRVLGALPALLQWRYPSRCRVLTLGVKASYRGRGLESVMLFEGLQVGFRVKFTEAEASWILEDNLAMRRMLEVFGATPYKTYRLYESDLR